MAMHTFDENTRPSLACAVTVIESTQVNVPDHSHPLCSFLPIATSTLSMVGNFAHEYPSYLPRMLTGTNGSSNLPSAASRCTLASSFSSPPL